MEDWAYAQDTGHINALAEPPQLLRLRSLQNLRSNGPKWGATGGLLASATCKAAKLTQKAYPALYVQHDETSAVRAKLVDVQEVMRTWYLVFYTMSQ